MMKLRLKKPAEVLNVAYLKQSITRNEIDNFKGNLNRLFSRIKLDESEEHLKNIIADFLKDTYYKPFYEVNTSGRIDLVIHNGKSVDDRIGVLFEIKRPANQNEMISGQNFTAKAMKELLHYYMEERFINQNIEIKSLIITNAYEWFVFDAADFEHEFKKNNKIVDQYKEWYEGRLGERSTEWFYQNLANNILSALSEIDCAFFNLHDYKNIKDDTQLIEIFKILSPQHLLKKPFANDSNTLNSEFYNELLYILGLEEVKESGKWLIKRQAKPNNGSLIENTIHLLKTYHKLNNIPDVEQYGNKPEEQLFSVALELCIIWLNRILFLKLLEGQLLTYHENNSQYAFLNPSKIKDFDQLNELFFEVFAQSYNDRSDFIREKYGHLPYLNSSLFEPTLLEEHTIYISSLKNDLQLPIYSKTVLKDTTGKARKGELNTLAYLLEFLSAYDFGSETGASIQEQNKSIINAAVLGLIFEKINGYKDGSFFTPGAITMYINRKTLRQAVISLFNKKYNWNCQNFIELYNHLDKINIQEANNTLNSIRICDPAVGSGHFLVSALNELIAIKHELGILADKNGKRLRDIEITIENDEIIVTSDNKIITYNYKDKESQRIQETLFNEKRTIIENCLFGVDINPKSVLISRLRLWIELLKHAYYKPETDFTELETLPNIDINIKCGDALLSRFELDADLSKALQQSKWNIDAYRLAVMTYRNARSKEEKDEMLKIINDIKTNFEIHIYSNDPRMQKLAKLKGELYELTNQTLLFEKNQKEKKEWEKKVKKLTDDINNLETLINDIKNNKKYKQALEWRFEFPEVLDDDGNYVGFDVIIGNPPYIQLQKDGGMLAKLYEDQQYKTFERTGDIYTLFYERGLQLLKQDGFLCYITSNKWMRAGYGEKLRQFFSQYNPLLLIDLGPGIFENATVDTNILLIQKAKNQHQLQAVSLQKTDKQSIQEQVMQNSVVLSNLSKDAWFIGSNAEQRLKEKIERMGKPLKEWDVNIYRGVLTGLNEAFIITTEKRNEILSNCRDEAERHRTEAIIKPILRGRDIKRYYYEWAGLWVIGIPAGWTNQNRNNIDAEQFIYEQYPSLMNYLKTFEEKAKKRDDKGDYWWELRKCAYYGEFEKEKVVWQELAQGAQFAYDFMGEYFVTNTAYILTGTFLKYILGYLNSRMNIFSYEKWYCTKLGKSGTRWLNQHVQEIPIPPITPENQLVVSQVEELVDQILLAKKQDKTADTTEWEREIDRLVYALYELTEEEIAIVEKNDKI